MTFFQHILRRAIRSIWENLYLNAVSGSVIGASLLLLGIYSLIQTNLSSLMDTWNKDVHVSVYFADDINDEERLEIRDDIHKMPEVVQVRYISELEAKQWLMEEVGSVQETLSELGDDVLPASLEITLAEEMAHPDKIEEFAQKIESDRFKMVDYGVEWVENFNAFIRVFQALGTMVGFLIIIAAMFLVTNTVHLVIYNRREELEIATLVGASRNFIVIPFLLEGAIQGLVGALGAIMGLWMIHYTLSNQLQQSATFSAVTSLEFVPFSDLLGLLLLGLVLGTLAAFVATYRFLSKI